MKCPDCGTEMKPLAFSVYCPNDCDRKVQEEIDPEKTPRMILVSSSEESDSTSLAYELMDWTWLDNIDWPSD